MKSFLLLAILSTVICVSVSSSAATWYVDGSVSSSGDGASWETAVKTIQEGTEKALEGDTVTVAEGTYVENIHFDGKNIILTSTDPLNPDVVAGTIIDGDQAGSVVTFSGTENEACVLSGFTIRNGKAADGGGICGGTYPTYTHATIQNNTIGGNSAESYGGGLTWCNGTIQNNTITGNSAYFDGGGLNWCNGRIQNNTIGGNSAALFGGALAYCAGTMQNNTISDNSAYHGGGLFLCAGTIHNNAITGNSAQSDGGGLRLCEGLIRNCIVWGNTAPTGPQVYQSSIPTYSCIEGWTGDSKKRNISGDPRFAGPDTGDFRLLPSSPCIDAGYNAPDLPETDIAGMHRVMFGGKSLTVDMGAYEFHIWPPTMNSEAAEVTLKWSSLTGKTYSVYQSGDMLSWDVLTDNVASAGDTVTTWIDSMGPILPPGVRIRYYRIMENP